MKLKKIYTYLTLTFLWSWINWIIGLNYLSNGIDHESIGKFLTFFFLGVYGPSISGIITTLLFDRLSGILNLFKKLIIWKVSFVNYLYLLLLPIVFVIVGIGIYDLFIGPIGKFDQNGFFTIPTILLAGLFAGPLGEELGWRGFLLPEFQKIFTNLKSALIIGIIWFIWHIPLFWAPFGTLVSGSSLTILPILTYFLMLISLSIIITWLVISSRGSVLIAILFHLSINAGIVLLFYPELNADFKIVHLLSSIPMLMFTIYILVRNKLN